MIVGVAALYEGNLYALMRPARHCNFSAAYNEHSRQAGWDFPWAGWEDTVFMHKGVQGFITSEGKFLDRKEGAKYAFEHGQIKEEEKGMLFSEDLW